MIIERPVITAATGTVWSTLFMRLSARGALLRFVAVGISLRSLLFHFLVWPKVPMIVLIYSVCDHYLQRAYIASSFSTQENLFYTATLDLPGTVFSTDH